MRHHQGKLPAFSESRLAHLEDLSPQSLCFTNLFSWCPVLVDSAAVPTRSCLAASVPHFCCLPAQCSRGAPRTEIAPPLPVERKTFEARVAGPGHVIDLFSLAGSLGRTVLSRENIPSCVVLVFLKLGLKLSKSKEEPAAAAEGKI